MEEDYIDAALVSYLEGDGLEGQARVARHREEVLATAGSRYTYCANTLASTRRRSGASKPGPRRHELPVLGRRRSCGTARSARSSKPIVFNIGLLCSKTFDDAIFEELFEAKYGIPAGHREDEHQGRLPDLDERRHVPRDP
jgi:coenzyme F420 hydrogenase subunit beta